MNCALSCSEGWRDASPIGAAPESLIAKGFLSQPVQAPRGEVLLDLLIPLTGIKSLELGPKIGPLLRRQLLDRSFDVLNAGHRYTV